VLTVQQVGLTAKTRQDQPSSEQLRPLIYKDAPPPQVVETFERLREFGR